VGVGHSGSRRKMERKKAKQNAVCEKLKEGRKEKELG
jgi:hypothetical protein